MSVVGEPDRWVDEPPPMNYRGGKTGPRRGLTASRLVVLLQNQGKWGAWGMATPSRGGAEGAQLKQYAEKMGVTVEATTRSEPDGTGTLYARVVPS